MGLSKWLLEFKEYLDMKKYTDKELKSMTSEKQEVLIQQCMDENARLGEEIRRLTETQQQQETAEVE